RSRIRAGEFGRSLARIHISQAMQKRTYYIDGNRFKTLEEFYEEITHELIPGAHWGKNLDAFNDILRGGFGTPENGFVLVWSNHNSSIKTLGYSETIRQLEHRLANCHSSAIQKVAYQLRDALNKRGPTVFDWLVEIIGNHQDIELILS